MFLNCEFRYFNHIKLSEVKGKTKEIPGTAILKMRDIEFDSLFIK